MLSCGGEKGSGEAPYPVDKVVFVSSGGKVNSFLACNELQQNNTIAVYIAGGRVMPPDEILWVKIPADYVEPNLSKFLMVYIGDCRSSNSNKSLRDVEVSTLQCRQVGWRHGYRIPVTLLRFRSPPP